MIGRLENRIFLRWIDSKYLIWFRCLFCAALAGQLVWDMGQHFAMIENIKTFNPIPLFEFFDIERPSEQVFKYSYYLLILCLIGSLQKHGTRLFLILSCGLVFYLFGSLLSLTKPLGTNYVFHSKNIIFFILFILAVSPKNAMRGLGYLFKMQESQTQIWPLSLIIITLGFVYFGSAYCKMAASGLEWMNGYTLQAYLYEHYLLLGLPQALWLAENYWLCVALSVAIIFFEFTFIVGVFVPSVSLIFVLGGLGLHAGILYFMDINFFSYHALAFLVFLRWDYVGAFSARVFRRSSSPVRNETL